jgi:DNA-binding response OmpR family regulator
VCAHSIIPLARRSISKRHFLFREHSADSPCRVHAQDAHVLLTHFFISPLSRLKCAIYLRLLHIGTTNGSSVSMCVSGTALASTLSMRSESAIAAGTTRKNLSICVLDDDSDHVEITTHRLEKSGFVASGTTDPEEALQQVRLGTCQLVLADLKMPKMDGIAFLEKALLLDPGVYVILVTGFDSVETAISAVKIRAYDYLSKPLDFARIEKSLDELAENFARRNLAARRETVSKPSIQRHRRKQSCDGRHLRDGTQSRAALHQRAGRPDRQEPAKNSSPGHFMISARARRRDLPFATVPRW